MTKPKNTETQSTSAENKTIKKVKLKAVHRIKGLKTKGEYIEPKEIFTTDTQTAESLVKRGGAVAVINEKADEAK